MCHDWHAKKANADSPIRMKRNRSTFPVLLWVSVRSPKLDAASQTLQKDGFHRQRSRSRSRIRKRSRKSAYDLLKIKHRSRKRSHKREGIRVRRIRTFLFLPTPLTTPSLAFRYDLVKTRLSESEAEAEGWTNQNACSHAWCLVYPSASPSNSDN